MPACLFTLLLPIKAARVAFVPDRKVVADCELAPDRKLPTRRKLAPRFSPVLDEPLPTWVTVEVDREFAPLFSRTPFWFSSLRTPRNICCSRRVEPPRTVVEPCALEPPRRVELEPPRSVEPVEPVEKVVLVDSDEKVDETDSSSPSHISLYVIEHCLSLTVEHSCSYLVSVVVEHSCS